MNPAIIVALTNAVICFLLYFVEKQIRRRLDMQADRLAEIEHHIGLAPLFPLDVECPICGAGTRETCRGSRGVSHAARFEVSPGAKRAQLLQRVDQAIERRLRDGD